MLSILFLIASFSKDSTCPEHAGVCLVSALCIRVYVLKKRNSHLEGGERKRERERAGARNQLIRDANRKAVNKRKKRMKKNWPAKTICFKLVRR